MIKIIQYALCVAAAYGSTAAVSGALWGLYSNYGIDPGTLILGGISVIVYAAIMGAIVSTWKDIGQ